MSTGLRLLLVIGLFAALGLGAQPSAHAVQVSNTRDTSVWPRPSFEPFPTGQRPVIGGGNGVIVDGGQHVLTYAALLPTGSATIYVRNGLGKVRRAERTAGDKQGDLVRLRLAEPYPAAWSLPEDQMIALVPLDVFEVLDEQPLEAPLAGTGPGVGEA